MSKFPLESEFRILSLKTRHTVNYDSKELGNNYVEVIVVFTLPQEETDEGLMRELLNEHYEAFVVTDLDMYKKYKEGLIMTTVDKTIDDDFDNGFVRIKFESTTRVFFEDVHHKAYIDGKGMLCYFEKQNYYVFHEFFCFTPTVEAILREIQGLRLGINHHSTTDAYVLRGLLNALSNFWH